MKFGFLVLWHINLHGLFDAEAILVEEQQWYNLTKSWRDMKAGGMWSISLKMNVIERLEFELAYNNVVDQYVSHNATGSPNAMKWLHVSVNVSTLQNDCCKTANMWVFYRRLLQPNDD